jgi:hypothetical protein
MARSMLVEYHQLLWIPVIMEMRNILGTRAVRLGEDDNDTLV